MRMITGAALAVVGVVAAVTTSVAGPASAAPAAVRPVTVRAVTVRAAAPLADELVGISCLTAKNCFAVGANANSDPSRDTPLAETWNGAAWHSVGVKLPAGALHAGLFGVTCSGTSGKDCVAVGEDSLTNYPPGYGSELADIWNGKAWAPTQLTTDAIRSLSAVSCLSPKNCLAVGAWHSPEGGYSGPIAFTWNGAKWQVPAIPAMPANYGSAFTGVSCVPGRFCVVTGYAPAAKTGVITPFSYQWNGKTWTAMNPVTPKGGTGLVLDSVSCASAKSCLAVGNGFGPVGDVAEVWNGRTWTVTGPIAWPKGTTKPAVASVSCATASYCLAVGSTNGNPLTETTKTGRALASVWNGKAWTATSVPAPAKGKASQFSGVTCLPTRTTFCAAVGQIGPDGSANGTGLSGFWNGKSWHLVDAR